MSSLDSNHLSVEKNKSIDELPKEIKSFFLSLKYVLEEPNNKQIKEALRMGCAIKCTKNGVTIRYERYNLTIELGGKKYDQNDIRCQSLASVYFISDFRDNLEKEILQKEGFSDLSNLELITDGNPQFQNIVDRINATSLPIL